MTVLAETKTYYDEVLDERLDFDQLQQKWFNVIIAAGYFVVRAFALDEAVLKSEVYADELASANVTIGNGLPLVINVTAEDGRFYDSVWFEGKPDVTLVNFFEDTSHLLPEKVPGSEKNNYNGLQLNLPYS